MSTAAAEGDARPGQDAPARSATRHVLVEQLRALAGGLILGIPLLYTIEVWWVGGYTSPARALVLLGVTFLGAFVIALHAGFHPEKARPVRDAAREAVEALALGLLGSAAVLLLLRVVTAETPWLEALTKVVLESAPFALGAVAADYFVDRRRAVEADEGEHPGRATLRDMRASVIGALVLAGAIAPTQEVPVLVAAATPVTLIVVVAASLALSYGLVFLAGFSNERKRRSQPGVLQRPLTETVVAYVVALLAAALMLAFFQNLALSAPLHESIGRVIVLGLPATIGGALGRIVV